MRCTCAVGVAFSVIGLNMAALLRVVRLRESNWLASAVLKWPSLSASRTARLALYSGGGDSASKLSEDDLYPQYAPREGESEQVKRARLLYQSR